MSLQERTLVVKNFDPDKTTANLLKELCLQGGPVRNVVVKPDHAFIEYEDVESVGYSKALLEGVELFGKKLVMEPKTRKVSYFKHTQLLHDYIRYDKQQRNQQQQLLQQQQQQQFQLQQQMIASFNQNPEQQAQYNNLPQPFDQNPNFPINFVNPQIVNNPVTTFQQQQASADFFTGQNQQMAQLHQQIPSHQVLPTHQMPPPQQMPIESQFHQPNQQMQQSNFVQRPNDNMRRSRSFNHHQQYNNSHQSNRNRRSSDWVTRRK